MSQIASLREAPHELRVELVKELGYATDGEFVLESPNGPKYRDPCTGDAVRLENMVILQGSTVILDDNPVSLDWYMDQYPGLL